MYDLYGPDNSLNTCECARNALVDMTYNLGEHALSEFEAFNSLMKFGEWDAAVDDLLYGTEWCRREAKRCHRNIKLIK